MKKIIAAILLTAGVTSSLMADGMYAGLDLIKSSNAFTVDVPKWIS